MNRQQIRLANQAETEIKRYKNDLVLWFKHVCNISFRAPQLIWMEESLQHNFYLCLAPPRMGKTFLIEMIDLFDCAINHSEEGRTWAPKESQAMDSLRYQLNAIKNSDILWNYLDWESGKRMYSSTRYQFVNKSNWHIHGIYGEFEGVNCTIIRGEEFDDLDIERFENRVIPRGGAKNVNGKPTRIRLTGTIQESKGNIYNYEMGGVCKVCTKVPIQIGLDLGYYDENIIEIARENLTVEEFRRIYELEYTSGRNFILEEYLEQCQYLARDKVWEGIPFLPGERYNPVGQVFCGFDCGHSGEGAAHSIYSLQLFEAIGDSVLWLNGFNWESTTDPVTLISDVVDLWYYYQIRFGYGDALKADLIAQINDALYNARLISTDRQKYPENSTTNWKKWDFSPVWNTGKFKYISAGILKNKIERKRVLIPRFDNKDDTPIGKAGKLLCSRLLNVREVTNKSNYPTLEYINPKLGDDDFDSACMAFGCINDRIGMHINMDLLGSTGKSTTFGGIRKSIGSILRGDDVRSGFKNL